MDANKIRRFSQLMNIDQDSLQVWLAAKTLDPTCANCYQYMSILPIKMTIYGYKICGRCSSSDQYKNIKTAVSSLSILMETKRFKCNNHYEGCKELHLKIEDVEQHEQNCIAKTHHECKLCSYDGTILQLIHHTINRHMQCISMDGVILLSLNKKSPKQTKLMVVEKNVFYADWELTEKKFTVKFKLLNQPNTRHYRLHFSTLIGQVVPPIIRNEYGFLRMQCDSYFEQSMMQLTGIFGNEANIQVKISFEEIPLERRLSEIRFREDAARPDEQLIKAKESLLQLEIDSITNSCNVVANLIKPLIERIFECSECKRVVPGQTVYFCPSFHGYCLDCMNGYCRKCFRIRPFKTIKYLEKFKIKCHWAGCGEILNLYNYLSHKRACSQRPYKCPLKDCRETRLSSAALVKHWHFRMPHLIQNEIIYFDSRFQNSEDVVWLYNHDLYSLSVYFMPKSVKIVIEELDAVTNNNFEHLNCTVQFGIKSETLAITRLGRRCESFFDFNQIISDEEIEYQQVALIVIIRMDENVDVCTYAWEAQYTRCFLAIKYGKLFNENNIGEIITQAQKILE